MTRAFSMIELVIVVVIAGIIAAIAVPRMSGYTERARERRVVVDLGTMQKAAALFKAEHHGLAIGHNAAREAVSATILAQRLTTQSNELGWFGGTTIFGPYLRDMPTNALNDLATIRVDGAAAGAGTHGWRYDSALDVFQSDEAFETTLPDGTTIDHLGVTKTVDSFMVLPG